VAAQPVHLVGGRVAFGACNWGEWTEWGVERRSGELEELEVGSLA